MANTTKHNRRKKKKKKNKAPVIVAIIIILLIIGAGIFVYYNWKKLADKATDLLPDVLNPNSTFTYPSAYEQFLVKYSNEYNVDPVLVASVIKTESNFDAKAESDVGARGLMQIMSDAFDWIKFRINDDEDVTFDDMYDAETNIKYGCYYLSFLMDKYDDSIDLTAAAYHCGMGTVDGWIENDTIDPDNFNVDDIPDENDQTSHYIVKINKAYDAYSETLESQLDISKENETQTDNNTDE